MPVQRRVTKEQVGVRRYRQVIKEQVGVRQYRDRSLRSRWGLDSTETGH